VIYAGVIAGRGVVSVAHPGGFRTTYEPVTSALRPGDAVAAGAPLGRLDAGHPGCPGGACLHWGLRQGNRYLDPLALLGLGRVRLLPLQPDAAP
jgi:murein DD-endopeptidase MepM/ murein hydrolase activator NlpD